MNTGSHTATTRVTTTNQIHVTIAESTQVQIPTGSSSYALGVLYLGQWPILDRDDETLDVITAHKQKSSNDFLVPSVMIMAIIGEQINRYVEDNKAQKIGDIDLVTDRYPVWKLEQGIGLAKTPIGAPAALILMENLIQRGAKKIIAVGSCGTLHDFEEGEFLVPVRALRDEGASYHYLEAARWITTNPMINDAVTQAINTAGFQAKPVTTWTTDGFYRETEQMIAHRREEGCDVVEMECSAFAACANFRNIAFGQLLFTADSLAEVDYQPRGWGVGVHAAALSLAHDAAKLIA